MSSTSAPEDSFGIQMEQILSGNAGTENILGGNGYDSQSVNAPQHPENTTPPMVTVEMAYELLEDSYIGSEEELVSKVKESGEYGIIGNTKSSTWIAELEEGGNK